MREIGKGERLLASNIATMLERNQQDDKFGLACSRYLHDPHLKGVRRLFETPVGELTTLEEPMGLEDEGERQWGVAAGSTLWLLVRPAPWDHKSLTIGGETMSSEEIILVAAEDDLEPSWFVWSVGKIEFAKLVVTRQENGWKSVELAKQAKVISFSNGVLTFVSPQLEGYVVQCWDGQTDKIASSSAVPDCDQAWLFDGACFVTGSRDGPDMLYQPFLNRSECISGGRVKRVVRIEGEKRVPRHVVEAEAAPTVPIEVRQLQVSSDMLLLYPKGTIISRPVWWRGDLWYGATTILEHHTYKTQLMRNAQKVGNEIDGHAMMDLRVIDGARLAMLTSEPIISNGARVVRFVLPDGSIEHGKGSIADKNLDAWPFVRTRGGDIYRYNRDGDIDDFIECDVDTAHTLTVHGEYVVYEHSDKKARHLTLRKRSSEKVCTLTADDPEGRFLTDTLVVRDGAVAYCAFSTKGWEVVIGPRGPCALPYHKVTKLRCGIFDPFVEWHGALGDEVVHVRWPFGT